MFNVFQHAAGAAAVTIVEDGNVIAGSDSAVEFTYQDALTPKVTKQNVTAANPQGNAYHITRLGLVALGELLSKLTPLLYFYTLS